MSDERRPDEDATDPRDDEIAKLRAALAAEQKAHHAALDDYVRLLRERDAAIARAERAERERDEERAKFEGTSAVLLTTAAQRDEARAACVALRDDAFALAHAEADWQSLQIGMLIGTGLTPEKQQTMLDQQARARRLREKINGPASGAPLLAELHALRALRDAAKELTPESIVELLTESIRLTWVALSMPVGPSHEEAFRDVASWAMRLTKKLRAALDSVPS